MDEKGEVIKLQPLGGSDVLEVTELQVTLFVVLLPPL